MFVDIWFTFNEKGKAFITLHSLYDKARCQGFRKGSHMLLDLQIGFRAGFCHSVNSSEQGDKCSYVSLSYIPLWPLYAPFHVLCLPVSVFLLMYPFPSSSSSACFSPLVFPVYWTETCWYEARLHGHKGTSLWCFWSAARSDMSTAPPCTLQRLIMQYNGQAQTTKDAHPHMFSLDHISIGTHTYKHSHTLSRRPVVHVLALLTVGWLVCWTQGSEREMVCVISPFLSFSAFDSKMDDCNHRSHQWDRVEVYGAGRHSHGKPAVRLPHCAAMGTLCCLFVLRFCYFICIFLSPLLCTAFWSTVHEKLPREICVGCVRGMEKNSIFTFHKIVSLL